MNQPIIRLEVEHMRHSMIHAFSSELLKMDDLFKQAITAACEPAAIQREVEDAARRYLSQAIEEEVKSFLLFGDGRKLVRKEIQKRLKADLG